MVYLSFCLYSGIYSQVFTVLNMSALLYLFQIQGHFYDRSIGSTLDRSKHSKLKSRPAHEGSITCLGMSEGLLVSGGLDRAVRVWAIEGRKLLHVINVHAGMVSS